MFHILPQECIFLIINFIIQYNKSPSLSYRRSWKSLLTEDQFTRAIEIRHYQHNKDIPIWKPPPFVTLLPLIIAHKEIFDTNEVWTYLYELDFRNGKPYIRKPLNSKEKLLKKAKEIIKKRYTPLIQHTKRLIEHDQEKLRVNLHQIHTLDIAFSQISPQIKRRENIDTHFHNCRIILKASVDILSDYIYPWGGSSLVPRRLDIREAVYYRDSHYEIGNSYINRIEFNKALIQKMERTIDHL